MIVTFPSKILQHCWRNIYKPSKMIATYLNIVRATCCTCLASLLRHVVTCWVLQIELVCMPWCNIAAQVYPHSYNIMQHPQCCMKNLNIFKLELITPIMQQQVAAGWPNACNMLHLTVLRSFGWGFRGLSAAYNKPVILVDYKLLGDLRLFACQMKWCM